MIVGVAAEMKTDERRVALTPGVLGARPQVKEPQPIEVDRLTDLVALDHDIYTTPEVEVVGAAVRLAVAHGDVRFGDGA
jgi:hypothetical protein